MAPPTKNQNLGLPGTSILLMICFVPPLNIRCMKVLDPSIPDTPLSPIVISCRCSGPRTPAYPVVSRAVTGFLEKGRSRRRDDDAHSWKTERLTSGHENGFRFVAFWERQFH